MNIVVYKGQKYHRYPDSKRRQLRVYFWRHDKWKESPIALHRQIWIDLKGPIPKGFIVHHRDGNTFNNSIDNFELLSPKNHAVLHMEERRIEKIGKCQCCKKKFKYFSIREAKFCSYKCYSIIRHRKILLD
jgi:hypothetical protein